MKLGDLDLQRESLYPRWGFLDKFAVNEYMAKALLVTVILWAAGQAGVATWLALRPATVTLVSHPEPPYSGVVIIDKYPIPPRPIPPNPRPKPRVDPEPMAGGTLRLADGLDTLATWDSQGVRGGTGTVPEVVSDADGAAVDFASVPSEPEIWLAVEREPELVSLRSPAYPELAREAGIEGKVLVRVLVGADGFVRSCEVLEGVLGLDEAALAAARTAVFKPAEQQGRAVATFIVIPIEFALHDR